MKTFVVSTIDGRVLKYAAAGFDISSNGEIIYLVDDENNPVAVIMAKTIVSIADEKNRV